MSHPVSDKAFEAVLLNTGQNIEAFVDEFFSFLARRSDFFVVSPPEGGRIGLPPGVAAKLIISKFKKWEDYFNKKRAVAPQIAKPPPVTPTPNVENDVPEAGFTIEVDENGSIGSAIENTRLKLDAGKKETEKEVCKGAVSKQDTAASIKNKKKEPVGLSDSYNGRKTDKYSWSQSIKELDVHIAVGSDVKTKKQVKVEIHMNKIRVVTGTGSETEELTDWQLSHPIVKDESYWSLYPGESIFFSLQKVKEMWWDHLFEGEERIDRSKIEAVRPMDDLEEEEQAKIQELVWNEEQKLKGLPTSEELKMEEVMKKAWNAEGSPFQGQPFDMSRIQLASNTINLPEKKQPPS